MNETEHTPGIWEAVADVEENGAPRWSVVTRGERQYFIAVIENGAPGDFLDTEKANALLIAAAPELLAACRKSLNWLSSYQGGAALPMYREMRAAIAKAKGGGK